MDEQRLREREAVRKSVMARMKTSGMTARHLAGRLGTTPQAVRFLLCGETLPSAPTCVRLADVLGCTVDQLLGRAP